MDFDYFIRELPKINNLILPGREAHFEMAPMDRVKELRDADIAKFNPRQAGVMALFYPDAANNTHFVLMLRKTYKGVHSNQVGFPGGKMEDEDVDIEATALRETEEEIGISREQIKVVRAMTNVYIPPSNFWVQCFVGYLDHTSTFVPQESEVEQLITVPITQLMDPSSRIQKTLSTSYATDITVPAFLLNDHVVWGATAMLLSEIKMLFNQILKT